MNIKEIREMIRLMNENDIREFELERDGIRVVLKRGLAESVSVMQQIPFQSISPAVEQARTALEAVPPVIDEDLAEIASPMVGTFYASPSPESNPFVEKGQKVKVGEVICIVEAMKVMNEIKADVSGTIEEILVENGEAIEYGQVLFKIRK